MELDPDGQPCTSSRALAKFLGVPHDEVLRLIEENQGHVLIFDAHKRIFARSAEDMSKRPR